MNENNTIVHFFDNRSITIVLIFLNCRVDGALPFTILLYQRSRLRLLRTLRLVALRRDEDRLRDTVDLERVWLGLVVTLDLFVLFWERLLRAVDLLRGLLWLVPRLDLLLKVLFRRFSRLLDPSLLFLLLLLFFFVKLRWVLLRAVVF